MKNYTFNVHGMHCNSCVVLIESKIGSLPEVKEAKSNLKNHSLEVTADFGDLGEAGVAEILTRAVKENGYTISLEEETTEKSWSEFKIAGPVAILFVGLFVLLQKLGIVHLIGGGNVTYGTALLVGIVASLSTCMAVVGGLVLSMSATFAKEGDKIKPQIIFHAGRIISFFILGGVIGAIGSAFTLSSTSAFLLGILVAIIMLILGINLLDVFPWAKKLQPSMPKFISRRALGVSKLNHTLTPFLAGIATFFLPCGFTQSMQVYTLTTGGFLKGGLTMLSFAAGTLPVLALISFSSLSIKSSNKSGVFFKSAGLVVIIFALLNLINALAVIGLIPPLFNF